MLRPHEIARQSAFPFYRRTVAHALELAGKSTVLQRYVSERPSTLQASNNLEFGVRTLRKGHALACSTVQVNEPWQTRFIVIDKDDELTPGCFPLPPSILVLNPENGHSHAYWELVVPVLTGDKAKPKPQRWLESVADRLRVASGGDPGYRMHLAKNPVHPDWHVVRTGRAYTLATLDAAVKGVRVGQATPRVSGLGRNTTLFDTLRFWAYAHVRDAGNQDEWFGHVLLQASSINAQLPTLGFSVPLPANEVASTARSVAKYCWAHRDRLTGAFRQRRLLQLDPSLPLKERQAMGAEHVNQVRRAASEASIREAVAGILEEGRRPTWALVAARTRLSRQALYQHHRALCESLLDA